MSGGMTNDLRQGKEGGYDGKLKTYTILGIKWF